jgi:outer membrane protein TolC
MFYANRLSRLQLQMKENSYEQLLQQTDVTVTETYFLILQTLSTFDVLFNHLTLAISLRDTAQVMFDNGIGLQTDVMLWELRIIEIENMLSVVESSLLSLMQVWAMVLGMDTIYDVPIPMIVDKSDILDEIRAFSVLTNHERHVLMYEFLDAVEIGNFDLANLRLAEESLTHLHRISRADFMPTVFARFSYDFDNRSVFGFDESSWQVVLNMSLPLFHSGRNFTQFRATQYQTRAQRTQLIEATRGLDIMARQTWFDFDRSVHNVIQAERAQELSDRTLTITKNLYAQGMTTNIALTDAQNSFMEAQIQLINSIYDFINKQNRINLFKGRR